MRLSRAQLKKLQPTHAVLSEPTVATQRPRQRVMRDPLTGYAFCLFPNPDPFVALHQALDYHYGAYATGGDHVSEVLLSNTRPRYRFDHALLSTQILIEADGYGAHRSLDAFKRDRHKQLFALERGWVVVRVSAEMIRNDLPGVIDSLNAINAHRTATYQHNIVPIGRTWSLAQVIT